MSAGIRVVKMSGAGNDFVVLGPEQAARLGPELPDWVRRVCRRGLSVGADGVVVVEPGATGRVRVAFRNPDGSEAFCGNGTRCAARFARLRGFGDESMLLETAAGLVPAEVHGDRVRLELPPPRDGGEVEIDAAGDRLRGRLVQAGVPHFVVFVAVPAAAPLERWGPAARRHPRFGPPGANFDVASVGGSTVTLRTWERGVERETLACGSGAVAAAFAAHLAGAPAKLRVVPASGIALEVGLPEGPEAEATTLTGDARIVFEGVVPPEATGGFAAG